MTTPYYEDDAVLLFHGDALDLGGEFAFPLASALVMDPPYGIAYKSNRPRLEGNARSIAADRLLKAAVRRAATIVRDDRDAAAAVLNLAGLSAELLLTERAS